MAYFGLGEGIRKIPAALQASGEVYSTALHNFVQHNQELLQDTICSRQLVQDYYPNASLNINTARATPGGRLSGQWGRFELQSGQIITCRIYAAKETSVYTDDTELHLFCTPKLVSPAASLTNLIAAYSDAAIYYATDTIDSTSYAYYTLQVRPNPQLGKQFYLSLWLRSADPGETDDSEIFFRFLSAYEEPEV